MFVAPPHPPRETNNISCCEYVPAKTGGRGSRADARKEGRMPSISSGGGRASWFPSFRTFTRVGWTSCLRLSTTLTCHASQQHDATLNVSHTTPPTYCMPLQDAPRSCNDTHNANTRHALHLLRVNAPLSPLLRAGVAAPVAVLFSPQPPGTLLRRFSPFCRAPFLYHQHRGVRARATGVAGTFRFLYHAAVVAVLPGLRACGITGVTYR